MSKKKYDEYGRPNSSRDIPDNWTKVILALIGLLGVGAIVITIIIAPQFNFGGNNNQNFGTSATSIPANPTTFPNPTVASVQIGCSLSDNNDGNEVLAGAFVPASSLLRPTPDNGTLYHYAVAGEALVNGRVWSYIDNGNNPASRACVELQYQHITHNSLVIIQ